MKTLKTLLTTVLLASVIHANAQDYNPYKSIGKKAKILTAYGDKFVEVFDYDTIQRIGSVLFNIKTKKIVKLLPDAKTFKKYSNNSSASRWYSIDRLSEKYYSLSPYNFCANNPILFMDPNGDSLVVNGSASAVQDFQNTVNNGLGAFALGTTSTGKYVLNPTAAPILNADGSIAVSAVDASLSLMDDKQKALYNSLNAVTTDPKDVKFDVINGADKLSKDVLVGDNGAAVGYTKTPGKHTIDMGDVKQFGTLGSLTSQGALTHEIVEGYQMQAKGVKAGPAHLAGIQSEGNVNGVTIALPPPGTVSGKVLSISVPVTTNGVNKIVTIQFTNGNIKPGGIINN